MTKKKKFSFCYISSAAVSSFITVGTGFMLPARAHTPTIFIFLHPFVSVMSWILAASCNVFLMAVNLSAPEFPVSSSPVCGFVLKQDEENSESTCVNPQHFLNY
ncbi:hypothetical protein AMECASPLE_008834 [Ameca splendens]|uniref:Uncharacterized protein n=1 Tax=Ameca splendens TaxID=208324 RepID=A0ABV0Y0H6_9TELE